jgi:transposase
MQTVHLPLLISLGRRSTAPVSSMSRSFFPEQSRLEWAIAGPMIPQPGMEGRKRSVSQREILNGIFYVLWMPMAGFAEGPASGDHSASLLHAMGLRRHTLERIHHALYVAVREQAGREVSPTTATIDSQIAKGAQKGGSRSIRRALMRERKSRVASGTFSSITIGQRGSASGQHTGS